MALWAVKSPNGPRGPCCSTWAHRFNLSALTCLVLLNACPCLPIAPIFLIRLAGVPFEILEPLATPTISVARELRAQRGADKG